MSATLSQVSAPTDVPAFTLNPNAVAFVSKEQAPTVEVLNEEDMHNMEEMESVIIDILEKEEAEEMDSWMQESIDERIAEASDDAGWVDNEPTNACRYGMECHRANCYFNHPAGWNPVARPVAPCRFGIKCFRHDCSFSHPEGRKTKPRTPYVNKY